MMKFRLYQVIMALSVFVVMLSCTDNVQGEFTDHHAFFSYPNVNTTPELRNALNSPGMFCKITFPTPYYRFTDSDGRFTQVNSTALDAYAKPLSIGGFLVGTPELPDMSGNFISVAYDLVCPNCFSESAIQRALGFKSATEMECGRCGRVYDLNNSGIVIKGDKGRPLFRYRMTYEKIQGLLVIRN